ncbi:MAG: exodeoxyribonuclease III [Candidatus Adiutrix sp.]|jgi:exodeoxyribonuclease-3|nr:exodeoxyribonuclease III [Candidatus Adiutrix sp.]
MKLLSWNVNGLRAISQKPGFWDWFRRSGADFIAFQETKASPEQLADDLLNPDNYLSYWAASVGKKGYSGVVTYAKEAPLSVSEELGEPKWRGEGRVVRLETPFFHFLNVYFPNGQKDEARLKYKLGYYDAFLEYAQSLRKDKPVVVCGDFNTAHRPVDIARPKENETTSGFLPVERAWFDKLVDAGYVDTFRQVNGENAVAYSWWSLRSRARANNVGWRIDYFFVSSELTGAVKRAWIEPEVLGSDHCPIGLELAF